MIPSWKTLKELWTIFTQVPNSPPLNTSDYNKPSDWMETPNAGTLRGIDPYAEWKKREDSR